MSANDGASPFGPGAPNSHPAFAPSKVTNISQIGCKIGKAPKPPEKPLMPYMRFSRKVWDKVRSNNQTSKLWEIGKVIGQMWRELASQEKDKFVQEWEAEKIEYNDALKAYHSSPAYQQFTKEKEKQQNEERDQKASNRSNSGTNLQGNKTEQTRINIPPLDNESDEFDQISIRQVAYNRFTRNQRLLLDIFGDACVPDSRTIVTTPRMSMLKKQVHSLSMHQKKLETELGQIDEQFQAKKRCIRQNSEAFSVQLDSFSSAVVSNLKYKELVEEAERKILAELEEKKLAEEKLKDEGQVGNGDVEDKKTAEEKIDDEKVGEVPAEDGKVEEVDNNEEAEEKAKTDPETIKKD